MTQLHNYKKIISNKPQKSGAGFTLMEIVVATSIFVVVFMALLALFNYTLKINRRSEALRQASQGMRSFVEFLVKEIRNGQVDYLVNNGTTNGQYINNNANVPCRPPGTPGGDVVSTITDTYYSKDNKLGIINTEGVEECFYLGKADGSYIDTPGGAPVTFGSAGTSLTLAMVKSGVSQTQILTPPNLSIQKLMFLISPVCNPYMASVDDVPAGVGCKNFSQHRPAMQPVVTILIKFMTLLPTGESVPIYYQTSVSTNKYDIPTP